jgi:hypothetical protein
MKTESATLVSREIQIEIGMRYDYTPLKLERLEISSVGKEATQIHSNSLVKTLKHSSESVNHSGKMFKNFL